MTRISVRLLLALIISGTFFTACKKKKDPVPDPPITDTVYADYAHYKTGNYWIYQLYDLDSSYNGTPLNIYDSVYVGPDTLYKGKSYHTVFRPNSPGSKGYDMNLYRDSSKYILDAAGNIVFSANDPGKIFSSVYWLNSAVSPIDSVGLQETSMGPDNFVVSVPAGTFLVKTFWRTWYMHPYFWDGGKVRKLGTCYAEQAGIVSETLPFYSAMAGYQEYRLVRYKVAK